eukprot:scaffold76048_cov70-Phaeocystis_antarctica.AAC.4
MKAETHTWTAHITARLDEHGGVAVNLRLRRYAHLRRPAQVRTGAPSWETSWAPPATEADGKRFTAPARPSQHRAPKSDARSHLTLKYWCPSRLVRPVELRKNLAACGALPTPRPRGARDGADAMAADPVVANRADRLLMAFVNVPAGVVLPMIGAVLSIIDARQRQPCAAQPCAALAPAAQGWWHDAEGVTSEHFVQ